MTALIIFGLVVSVLFSAILLYVKQLGIQCPVFLIGIACLLIQAAYLLLILFENAPDSEMWMFLALSYIPLSISIFIVLSVLSITNMRKAKTGLGRLEAFAVIPIHGIGSYLILSIWGCAFQLPL